MTSLPLTLRPSLPRSLYIETTSRCNSLCETCILTFGGREPQKDLGWTQFRTASGTRPGISSIFSFKAVSQSDTMSGASARR